MVLEVWFRPLYRTSPCQAPTGTARRTSWSSRHLPPHPPRQSVATTRVNTCTWRPIIKQAGQQIFSIHFRWRPQFRYEPIDVVHNVRSHFWQIMADQSWSDHVQFIQVFLQQTRRGFRAIVDVSVLPRPGALSTSQGPRERSRATTMGSMTIIITWLTRYTRSVSGERRTTAG